VQLASLISLFVLVSCVSTSQWTLGSQCAVRASWLGKHKYAAKRKEVNRKADSYRGEFGNLTVSSDSRCETSIYVLGTNPVVRFASEELTRYLGKMTGVKHTAMVTDALPSGKGIFLGGVEDLAELGVCGLCQKSELDDVVVLKTHGDNLFITGSNPRSVLFATYRYLGFQGAEWLWPGEDGELLPEIHKAKTEGLDLKEHPSYRHRGVAIEGAVTPEIVIDFIDWMAKHGMNEFHLQFKSSLHFYNRYYAKKYNPFAKPLPEMSVEDAMKADSRVIQELKKRGMLLEMVGHGFTCGSIGIDWYGWDVYRREITEEQRELTALVGGRRGLVLGMPSFASQGEQGRQNHGIPVNTELCYSNPKAFNKLTNHVVQYAMDHPEVELLHFWLSDGWNNHCECPDCQKLSPSDWFVKLVNAISRRLGELDLRTRLVFLSYSNTLWPPTQEKIENKYGNVIFMFAPITRCFLHSLADTKCGGPTSSEPPPRNKAMWPKTNYEHLQLLRGWQKYCRSDSFIFDYHLFRAIDFFFLGDIGTVLWRDLRDLQALGMNGINSCQTLRAFYPTGIPMAILAQTVWNNRASLTEIKNHYLKTVFGDDATFVLGYLDRIYSFTDPGGSYGHRENMLIANKDRLQRLLGFVQESRPRLEEIAEKQKGTAQRKSALYLLHHNTYVTSVLQAAILYSEQKKEESAAKVDEAIDHLLSTEDEILKVADVALMSRGLEQVKMRMKQ